VTVTGGRFKAELYDDKGLRVATLEGQERNGVVDAKVERHATADDIRSMRATDVGVSRRAESAEAASIHSLQ
jgi:hypothetical protein